MIKGSFAFIFFLSLNVTAYAENVWIHIVGVDEITKTQNFPYFYKSAENFNKKCKTATGPTQCHLFINNDPSLHAPNYQDYPEKIDSVEGAPDETKIKALLKEKIVSARSGETVIISLQNHGAPAAGKSAACIWMKADDKICSSDLAEILKLKPPGVKVVINADGCFSGAFAELSSKEVCTVTSASRLYFGKTQLRDFWNAVSDRHPKTLADLREPIIAESGEQKLLGSQVILQQLCAKARKRMNPKDVISALTAQKNTGTMNDDSQCRDADATAKKMATFSAQVLNVVQKQNETSCLQLDVPQVVCDAERRLSNATPEIKKTIKQLLPIAAQEERTLNWSVNNHNLLIKMMNQSSALLKNLSAAELKEFADSAKLGIDPDYSKMSPSHVASVKALHKLTKPFFDQMRLSREGERQTDQIVRDLKEKGYFEDLLMVQNCFLENQPIPNDKIAPAQKASLEHFANISKQFPEKKFTEHDYLEAVKCEASVSF